LPNVLGQGPGKKLHDVFLYSNKWLDLLHSFRLEGGEQMEYRSQNEETLPFRSRVNFQIDRVAMNAAEIFRFPVLASYFTMVQHNGQ
jgi:hypothetical protein